MPNPWRALEEIPGFIALGGIWRKHAGDQFRLFRQLCLEPTKHLVTQYPCPYGADCAYELTRHPDATITGICPRNPDFCKPATFTQAAITPLQLSWTRLARALCQCFGLNSKFLRLPIPNTVQIGTWSADPVPVILTIQTERSTQRLALAELVVHLNQKFILLSPTGANVDYFILTVLSRVQAAFFPLETTVRLTDNATLIPQKTPGELFQKFTPCPAEPVAEAAALQLFALAKTLDTIKTRKAPPSVVLRMYCVDGWEPERIAGELHCARSLIYSRLGLLSKKLGRGPAELRTYSAHFEKIQDSLSDSRAKSIHRQSAVDPDESSDE